jgi:HlyD family secretion protein
MTTIRRLLTALRARPRQTGLLAAGLAVTGGAGASWLTPSIFAPAWPTAVARQADFVETLVETGTLAASRLLLYSATNAGAASKIVEIAPEGSAVAPGDVLVRFDTAAIELALQKETAALRQAEAEWVRAREDQRIEELRVEADAEAAAQDLTLAEQELRNDLEGRGRLEVAEAEASLAEAEREVARTRRAYDDTKPLLDEGFVTRAELERTEQAWQRAEEARRLARLKLDSLTAYERPASIEKARSQVQSARQGAIRQAESASARLAQRRASVAIAASRADEARARVDVLGAQLSRTTIRAEAAGLVVHRELFFGADRRRPQVGDEVWPNQPLIALPDSSHLLVETAVRESDLHRVSASQRVFVRVEAYPDLRLRATVQLVGALAVADAARAGVKRFPLTVRLIDHDARLRAGMTARVEIEVATLPAATVVPAAALVERDADLVVHVLRRGAPRAVPVLVAGDNGLEAAVTGGVRPGDTVLLVDPAVSR